MQFLALLTLPTHAFSSSYCSTPSHVGADRHFCHRPRFSSKSGVNQIYSLLLNILFGNWGAWRGSAIWDIYLFRGLPFLQTCILSVTFTSSLPGRDVLTPEWPTKYKKKKTVHPQERAERHGGAVAHPPQLHHHHLPSTDKPGQGGRGKRSEGVRRESEKEKEASTKPSFKILPNPSIFIHLKASAEPPPSTCSATSSNCSCSTHNCIACGPFECNQCRQQQHWRRIILIGPSGS